ncbi:MAG: zinc ABC transporter substrate-binding protein [Chitinophagales bacterium]
MNKADIIIYNGLFLEGKLDGILKKLSTSKNVINFSDGIQREDLLGVENAKYEGEIYDPHIWFGIDIWKQGIVELGAKLSSTYPQFADEIATNQTSYLQQLDVLKQELLEQISNIPIDKRLMVTSHDAFHYFGRMLAIRVEALQGISTATDFGLQDRKQLVDLIIEEDISAIFIESSVGDKPIKAIVSDCQERGKMVTLGGTLFSDAMGEDGTPEGTYIGMLKHNVATVVKGLSHGN